MSEPIRYAMSWGTDENEFVYVSPKEQANGNWVKYEDYARLKEFSDEAQAHITKEERKSRERLDMEQAENAHLKAEVERLTEAWVDKKMQEDRDALLQQVERLTKAGDAFVLLLEDEGYSIESITEVNKWNAAKEGKGQP